MSKTKKILKPTKKKTGSIKEKEEKVVGGEEEETEKETSTLSDGVLDAFDEVAPVDPLLLEDDEVSTPENEEDDDEIDSGDYKPLDDW